MFAIDKGRARRCRLEVLVEHDARTWDSEVMQEPSNMQSNMVGTHPMAHI
jgi:hypothetical protein